MLQLAQPCQQLCCCCIRLVLQEVHSTQHQVLQGCQRQQDVRLHTVTTIQQLQLCQPCQLKQACGGRSRV